MKQILTIGMLLLCTWSSQAAESRPNVLFIISDDLNNNLGTYDHPQVQSPNIDALAKRSLQFDRAYCQFPFCGPSRTSMLTGLYPMQTKIYGNGTPIRARLKNIVTLPEFFKNNGYYTSRVGKIFHYGVPGDIGTDGLDDPQSWNEVVNPIGRDRTEESEIYTTLEGKYNALSWRSIEGDDDQHTDGQGALATIRLLEEHAEKRGDQPFFTAFGIYRPHTPFVAPKKYFDLYPLDSIEVPDDNPERTPAAAYLKAKPEHDSLTHEEKKKAIQAYYACTTFLDAQVGRVLDTIERLGLAENTIIVFTSDHGYHLGDHGLWQKRSLFENSARVPLLIATPNTKKTGKRSNAIVELLDLYPTLAALGGFPIPTHTMGQNLAPLLDGADDLERNALTMETRNMRIEGRTKRFQGHSIRTDRYRYTEWDHGQQGIELYDYHTDPDEQINLVNNNKFNEIRVRMRKLMNEKLASMEEKDLQEWK